MLQRTMERGANAVVGYSLTDAQIFGEIGFAALSPSVYHNKQFSSATYMQQIAHKYVDYFLYGNRVPMADLQLSFRCRSEIQDK